MEDGRPVLQALHPPDGDPLCGADPGATVPLRHHHSPRLLLGGEQATRTRLSRPHPVSTSL